MMERAMNESNVGAADGAADLLHVVDKVRRRWRMARVLRGSAIVVVALFATLITAAALLDALAYDPTAVIVARIFAGVIAAALVARYVVRPFLPKPPDAQVALYVEEHEPSLEGALVSAVEVSKGPAATA